jgi:type II secretory pathway pseudopilin PulG
VDIQTATIVITGIGVLVAAVNQIYMSRQANEQRERELETRQIELFMQIYRQRHSPEFVRSWIRFGQHG